MIPPNPHGPNLLNRRSAAPGPRKQQPPRTAELDQVSLSKAPETKPGGHGLMKTALLAGMAVAGVTLLSGCQLDTPSNNSPQSSVTFNSDGSFSHNVGNFSFNSDGTTGTRVGNYTFNSDGSITTHIGNYGFRN